MNRRNFLKVVGAGAAVVAVSPTTIKHQLYGANGELFKSYERVQLVDANGKPIKTSDLKKETNYVFNYPHVGTPCLLINLSEPSNKDVKLKDEMGTEYIWKGGIGEKGTVVAFSAICTHQLTHPNKVDSFMSYVPKDKKTMAATPDNKGGYIVCSSHLSVFDVKNGANNIAGAAPQPLASIVLEEGKDGSIWAVAVNGNDKFHTYFKSFKSEMKEQWGGKRKAKKLVKVSAPTVTLNEYTQEIISY